MAMSKHIRIALSFARSTRDQLNCFAILVIACLKNNPRFPNLPVSIADLSALQTTYQAALTAATIGGPKDTAAFHEARAAMVLALRQIVSHIQSLGLTNESDVMSSGFDVVTPDNRQKPLTLPVLNRLDNSVSGQLAVALRAVPNAKAYHAQYGTGTGPWLDLGIFPNTKDILIPDLTPGTVYSVRVRAVGGSTKYSGWSTAISLMST